MNDDIDERQLNKDQKDTERKEAKAKGKAKWKERIAFVLPALVAMLKILLIVSAIILVYEGVQYVLEGIRAVRMPEETLETLVADEVEDIVEIKGNSSSGYYLGYAEGFDQNIETLAEEMKRSHNLQGTSEELIEKMIRAQLVAQYPNLGGNVGDNSSSTGGAKMSNVPKLFMSDYGDIAFKKGGTVATNGCGFVSLAMVLSYITGKDVTVQEVVDWGQDAYYNGEGAEGPMFAEGAKNWNAGKVTTGSPSSKTDVANVKEALQSGKPVIALMGPPVFTSSQHFIVLTGIDKDNKVSINDSGDRGRDATKYDFEDGILKYARGFWIFESGAKASAGSSSVLKWPSDTKTVNSEFGYRPAAATGGVGSTNHKGIDIPAPANTPVYAIEGGTVLNAEFGSANGNFVKIQHPNGYVSFYLHNTKLNVSAGDTVNKGDTIAFVGSTGNSTGPHIHLQIHDENNNPVDPKEFKFDNGYGNGNLTLGGSSAVSLDGFVFIGDEIMAGLKKKRRNRRQNCL